MGMVPPIRGLAPELTTERRHGKTSGQTVSTLVMKSLNPSSPWREAAREYRKLLYVVLRSLWPSNSWIVRMSVPFIVSV